MKKGYLILLISILFGPGGFGQPSIQWQMSLGGTAIETGIVVKPATNGGYIYAAESNSIDGDVTGNHGNIDVWVVKTDSMGNIEWEKSLGGSGDDICRDMIVTPGGNYLLACRSNSTDGDVTGYHGTGVTTDIWILMLDTQGTILWSRCYGGTQYETINALNVIRPTADGGYLLTGTANSNDGDVTGYHAGSNPYAQDIWILKIDSSGNLLWQKCLGGSAHESGGVTLETPDGGYISSNDIFGTTDGDVVGNVDTLAQARSIWVARMDPARSIVWQHIYGGSSVDYTGTLGLASGGGYILGCTTESSDGDITNVHGGGYAGDFWVVKIDSLGGILWQRCYGADGMEHLTNLLEVPDGGYLLAGNTFDFNNGIDGDITQRQGNFDVWVAKIDTAGTLQWQHNYGGTESDQTTSIFQTADGGFVLPASSYSNNGDVSGHHGSLTTSDVWLVKLSSFINGFGEIHLPLHALEVYPNPMEDMANISFYLDEPAALSMKITDLSGREVAGFAESKFIAGSHLLKWNASSANHPLDPGIYFVKLNAATYYVSAKLCIIR